MMKTEVTARQLAKLLGLTSSTITDLAKRKIIVSGSKRGTYRLQESIRNYVEHLRRLPAGQGSEGIFKQPTIDQKMPVAAQADVAKTTAEQMHGEMVLSFDLEKPETTRLRSFRNQLLDVDKKQDHLLPRVHVRSTAKRVRSFQIYIRDGRCYTVWHK